MKKHDNRSKFAMRDIVERDLIRVATIRPSMVKLLMARAR